MTRLEQGNHVLELIARCHAIGGRIRRRAGRAETPWSTPAIGWLGAVGGIVVLLALSAWVAHREPKTIPRPRTTSRNDRAMELLAAGRPEEARALLERALAGSEDAGLMELLGRTYAQTGPDGRGGALLAAGGAMGSAERRCLPRSRPAGDESSTAGTRQSHSSSGPPTGRATRSSRSTT